MSPAKNKSRIKVSGNYPEKGKERKREERRGEYRRGEDRRGEEKNCISYTLVQLMSYFFVKDKNCT